MPPAEFATFDEWRHATQPYQAKVLRHHIETAAASEVPADRRVLLVHVQRPGPMVSWSVLDHERVPKLAYQALRRACRPVIVVADRLPDRHSRRRSRLDVHAVNDLRHAVDPAVVDVVARWAGGERRWRFGGAVGADECVKVGTIEFDVPDTLGVLTFDLTLTAGDDQAPRTTTPPPSPCADREGDRGRSRRDSTILGC